MKTILLNWSLFSTKAARLLCLTQSAGQFTKSAMRRRTLPLITAPKKCCLSSSRTARKMQDANIDAVETAGRFGIERNRAQNYCADSVGSKVVYEEMAKMTVAFCELAEVPEEWNANIEADYKRPGRSK